MGDTVSAEQAMKARPKVKTYSNLPESEAPSTTVILFICPTPGCGNHYAAPNFQPEDVTLDTVQHRRGEHGLVDTRTRRDCPDCWLRDGKRVPREPFVVLTVLPLDKMMETIEKGKAEVSNGDRGSAQQSG